MEEHYKVVNGKELRIYQYVDKYQLSPKLISFERQSNNTYIIITERYPFTLMDIIRANNRDKIDYILNSTKLLLTKLHRIGVIHGDISEDNIVYDDKTNQVRLIDFGFSEFINSLSDDEIEDKIEDLYEGEKYANISASDSLIDKLKKTELGIVEFLKEYYLKINIG